MDLVKVLLDAGADPSIADEEGCSCVHAAVDGYCNKDTLQALIDHGAHIDATRKDGTNALLRACTTGQSDSVMFLLEAKADVNIAKPNGNTCLHEAIAGQCNGEALQKIIQLGVNVNSVNNNSETALILACYTAQAWSIKCLLENGADPNISDAYSYTCLHAAVKGRCSNETLQEIVIHEAHLDAQNTDGETALCLACLCRQQDFIEILLTCRSNPNVVDNNGETCLHAAIIGGCSTNIVSTLLDHGADVNATSKDNVTVLMLACEEGNTDAINVLLNAGADPNIADAYGNTCLHDVARNDCCTEVLQAIIDYGVDVRLMNKNNRTASMTACAKGNSDVINVLLNAGPNPSIIESDGGACLHNAAHGDCGKEVVQPIIGHYADVNATNKYNQTSLMLACEKGNKDAITVLLNAGADPNIADDCYNTCLHYAARNDSCTEVLQAIISHGADKNVITRNNRTALMTACQNGNKDAINVLPNAGADPDIAGANGSACLHPTAYGECSTEALQAIISNDVDVNASNKNNVRALMLVCEKGNKGAIDVLLKAGADPNMADAYGCSCLHYAAYGDCSIEAMQAIISHGVDVNAINKNNITALMLACDKWNKEAINVLLSAGADPNIADVNGNTCLHDAARNDCCTEVLQEIISHGVDVNATNKSNITALMLTCEKWNKDDINVLLSAGADPNLADANGNTCLHKAARNHMCTAVLQTIISHGIDVDETNKSNVTALMIACEKGNEDAVKVLLNAGADPYIADIYGNTCLHCAVRFDCCTEVLQAIISHDVDVDATNKYNVTSLMIACEKGNKDAMNVLFHAGADPNIVDANGNTCLHYAARNHLCTEVLQAIISHGVDVDATNKGNVAPLMIASENWNKDAIDVLLNAGADPNISDANGSSCLHYAAYGDCSIETMQAIISNDVDVNATNKNNVTALMLACEKKNKDATNVLLHAGADPNIADANGSTCLHYAARNYYCTEVLQAVISHGVDVNAINKNNITALRLACEKKNKDAVNGLLNAGADPNIADANGNTCLHFAARNYLCTEVLQAVISHGVDVNATNKMHVTALMIACEKGNKDAVNGLLNDGADPNIADAKGNTCLHYAARNDCCTEVLQAMISNGVDVNRANKMDVTALMIASGKGNTVTINVLLSAGADPDIVDGNGNTCLHNAVLEGCGKYVLNTILKHGINVNATNKDSVTALMIACMKANKDAITVLLYAGADPKIADSLSTTCIHHAVSEGCSKEVLEAIVDHGADVNATDKDNETALMIACKKDNVDAINALLNAGADSSIVDAYGCTCLLHAIDGGCSKETFLAIIDHGADVTVNEKQTALMKACQMGNLDVINILLNAGLNLNIASIGGNTFLHFAVEEYCKREILQTIIKHGADVNAANKQNKTALYLACHKGNVDAINVLLRSGAHSSIASADGYTLLHFAVLGSSCKETLQSIIDHSTDINASNNKKQCALVLACTKQNITAVSVLLEAGADPNIPDAGDNTLLHYAVKNIMNKDVLQKIINHGADVNAVNKKKSMCSSFGLHQKKYKCSKCSS